jgi:sugar/nucleoside kinase (ribokinase family)
MRVAVVGHVEWIEFARVEHAPAPGEIVHAHETWQEVGGGGAVAAVQLARLAGTCLFLTALGDDSLGRRAYRDLDALGVRVAASWRSEHQRRAFVHVDAGAERTITCSVSASGRAGMTRFRGRSSTAPTPYTSRRATRKRSGRLGARASSSRRCARSSR